MGSPVIELPEGAPLQSYQRYVHELEALHGWLGADLVRNGFLMGEEVGELFAAMRRVQRQLDNGTPRAELPEPLIGDPTSNWHTLEYVAGEQTLRREFSASAQAFLGARTALTTPTAAIWLACFRQ